MQIGLLRTRFHLTACHSLKQKRRIIAPIKSQLGKRYNIALCESQFQDSLKNAEFSFSCIANDKKGVELTTQSIIDYLLTSIDAELVEHQLEWL